MSKAASQASTAAGGHGTLPEPLRRYFSPAGEGGAKIRWGACGDYDRAVDLLVKIATKHPGSIKPEEIHGEAGNMHEEFAGMSTAAHAKLCGGKGHNTSSSAARVLTQGKA